VIQKKAIKGDVFKSSCTFTFEPKCTHLKFEGKHLGRNPLFNDKEEK
jgi:predicted metal-binding protein